MSGIVGIVNLDGRSVDRELLIRMTGSMRNRAPDGSSIWCSGNVGFGHAMLRTLPESAKERQPCTIDGRVWITADARIDGRTELISKLRAAGTHIPGDAPDAELILHAYGALGESLTDHLIGDFAFALWDARNRKLICVRDHLGVKPFFYARTAQSFVFASDIRALLRHPDIGTRLDETAIGDFLMMGCYLDAELTIYQAIRCLPPAHAIHLDQHGFRLRPYWKLSADGEIRYRRQDEYFEQFLGLFRQAVEDRMRADSIVVEMSGGMDSTAIASIAVDKARRTGAAVTAFTGTCDSLLPEDRERHFAGLAAKHLGIPIVYTAADEYALCGRQDRPELQTAEPVPSLDNETMYETAIRIAKQGSRVTLNGFAGDAVILGSGSYLPCLLRRGRLDLLFLDLYRHWRNAGTLRGSGLRSMVTVRHKASAAAEPEFELPDWLGVDFVKRLQLEERWRLGWDIYRKSDPCDQLARPWTAQAFTGFHSLQMPLESRYPFLDLRLVRFLLALPNQMKFDKFILREIMRGRLPEAVRTRPKQGLAGDLIRARIASVGWRLPLDSPLSCAGNGYVDRVKYRSAFNRYLEGAGAESTFHSEFIVLPIALDNWMLYR